MVNAAWNMSVTWGRLEAVGWSASVMGFNLSRQIIGWAVLTPAGLGNADPKVGGPTCALPLCNFGHFQWPDLTEGDSRVLNPGPDRSGYL